MKADRKWQAEESDGKIKSLLALDPPLHKKVWHQMKGWYKSTYDRVPLPAQVTLEWITADWFALYRRIPPRGRTSLYMLKLSWWMTWYLRRKISSGWCGGWYPTAPEVPPE